MVRMNGRIRGGQLGGLDKWGHMRCMFNDDEGWIWITFLDYVEMMIIMMMTIDVSTLVNLSFCVTVVILSW